MKRFFLCFILGLCSSVSLESSAAKDYSDSFNWAKIHYRWRYLNQIVSQWKSIDLDVANGLRATDPFDLPGCECDVEYWFSSLPTMPFYRYVDYSGKDVGVPHSERRGVNTNRLDAIGLLPSCGTDWFFRLRSGKSFYAGFDMVFKRGTAPVERTHLFLCDNFSWRGFIQTSEDYSGSIYLRFEGIGHAEGEFAETTGPKEYWRLPSDNPQLPVTAVLISGDEFEWAVLSLPAASGLVLAQLNEQTMTLTLTPAAISDFEALRTTVIGGN